MKTNDERFEAWWYTEGEDLLADADGDFEKIARAAVNALCLSDEDRETCVDALKRVPDPIIGDNPAWFDASEEEMDEEIARRIATSERYAAVRRRLEGHDGR